MVAPPEAPASAPEQPAAAPAAIEEVPGTVAPDDPAIVPAAPGPAGGETGADRAERRGGNQTPVARPGPGGAIRPAPPGHSSGGGGDGWNSPTAPLRGDDDDEAQTR